MIDLKYDKEKDFLIQYYPVKEDGERLVDILEKHNIQDMTLEKGVIVTLILKNARKNS